MESLDPIQIATLEKTQAEIRKAHAEALKAEAEKTKIDFELEQQKEEISKRFWRTKQFRSDVAKTLTGITILGFYIIYSVLPVFNYENFNLKLANQKALIKIDSAQDKIRKDSQTLESKLLLVDSLSVALTTLTDKYGNVLAASKKDSTNFATQTSTYIAGFNKKVADAEKAKREVDRLQKKIMTLPKKVTIQLIDGRNDPIRGAFEMTVSDGGGVVVRPITTTYEYGFVTYVLPTGPYVVRIKAGGYSQVHEIGITDDGNDTIFTYKFDF